MAKFARKPKRYPSDLTDEEGNRSRRDAQAWALSCRHEVDFREVINAVRYLVRSGCGWRMRPVGFGACDPVYGLVPQVGAAFSVPAGAGPA